MPRLPPSSKVSMDAMSFKLFHCTINRFFKTRRKSQLSDPQKSRGLKQLEFQKSRHIKNPESVREPSPATWTTKIQHFLVPNLYFLLILFKS